jgi:hypothetical protein
LLIRWPWQNNHGRKTKDQKGSLKLSAKPLSMLKGKFGCKNKEKVECTLLISLYRIFVPATSWYGFGNSYLMYVVTVRDSPEKYRECWNKWLIFSVVWMFPSLEARWISGLGRGPFVFFFHRLPLCSLSLISLIYTDLSIEVISRQPTSTNSFDKFFPCKCF